MYDYVLRDGLIVDGSRNKPYKGSLCIEDGKIVDITEDIKVEGKTIINCADKVISPGFIDLHTHSDACPLNSQSGESMLHQGVTLQIGGNCGISLIPSNDDKKDEIRSFFARTVEIVIEDENLKVNNMTDYTNIAEGNQLPINSGVFIGHGTLRAAVIGFDDRKATSAEMEEMKNLLDDALKNGAYGMSLGLIYPPSSYGDVEEFTELAKVIKENNGILTTHMRNEGEKVFESVDEMIEVAEKSGAHLHISHLKLMGKPQWGKSQQLLDKIEGARQRGCTITCDQYPYEATSTGLAALVPGWALDGGNAKMLERLKVKKDKLLKDMKDIMEKRGGPERVVVSSTHGKLPEFDGKNLEEIANILGVTPVEAAIEILLKCNGGAAAVYFSLSLDDVLNIMKSMDIAIGSDGLDFNYDINYNPHPRNFGTFPRFLQMAREHNLMPLEDAIYKITGLPARILRLPDRGIIKVGNVADITVFDSSEVEDMSTFIKSPVKPKGIYHVFVEGKPVLQDGKQTQNKNGQVLLKIK